MFLIYFHRKKLSWKGTEEKSKHNVNWGTECRCWTWKGERSCGVETRRTSTHGLKWNHLFHSPGEDLNPESCCVLKSVDTQQRWACQHTRRVEWVLSQGLWNLYLREMHRTNGYTFPFLLCLLLLFFSQLFVMPPQTTILPFCISFSWGWSWSLPPLQCHEPPSIVLHRLLCPLGFSRQEYLSGLPRPSPGDLPNPGVEPVSLRSPALAGRFFTTSTILGIWPNPCKQHCFVHLELIFKIKFQM